MRHLKQIQAIMAVILLLWGFLFYSHARAHTVNVPLAAKDVGAKIWPLLAYDDDDDYYSSDDDSSDDSDYDYDDGSDDDDGDDDGGDDD